MTHDARGVVLVVLAVGVHGLEHLTQDVGASFLGLEQGFGQLGERTVP